MISIFQLAYQSIKQEVMTDQTIKTRHIVLNLIAKQDIMAHYFKNPQLNIFPIIPQPKNPSLNLKLNFNLNLNLNLNLSIQIIYDT